MGVEVKRDPAAEGDDPFGAERSDRAHLIITASPTAQEVIGSLIGMMLESKPQSQDPASTYPTPSSASPGFEPSDDHASDPFSAPDSEPRSDRGSDPFGVSNLTE